MLRRWLRNQRFAIELGWKMYREATIRPILTKHNLKHHQPITIEIDLPARY